MRKLLSRLPRRKVIGILFLVSLVLLLIGSVIVAHFSRLEKEEEASVARQNAGQIAVSEQKDEATDAAQQNADQITVAEKGILWGGLIVALAQIPLGSALGIVLGDLSRTAKRPNQYLLFYVVVGVLILVLVTFSAMLDQELRAWLESYRGAAGVFAGSGLGALLSRLGRNP